MRRTLFLTALLTLAALPACGRGGEPSYVSEPLGWIAFTSDRDGNPEVYVMKADGSSQANLTGDSAPDAEPSWSPDGARIAFSSIREGLPDLYVMDADGGDLARLTADAAVDGGARWSPDGSLIAFYSFRSQGQGLLWLMNADGSDVRPLLESIIPAYPETACAGGFPGGWFPDGQRILYRGAQGDIDALQICSVTSDGSDITIIYSEPAVFSHFPTLSPDGRSIAFTSNRDGNSEIYVIDANGKNRRRLTMDPAEDMQPSWSPDGQWLAFASNRDGDYEIYIMRPDGSDVRQLTHNDAQDSEPAWSPGSGR